MVREYDLNQEEESHGHQDPFAGHDLAYPGCLVGSDHTDSGSKKTGTVGRPPTPNRVIFDAMIFVLRNGCQGQAIPREPTHPDRLSTAGSASGCNKACSSELGRRCCITHYYDKEVDIAWKWQALDGVITKASLGGEDTGTFPVDRGKKGTKRSVLTDQQGARE